MAIADRLRRLVGAAPPKTRAQYDGSRTRRRLANWIPPSTAINALLAQGGETLRNRARDICRNNPHATSAVESFVSNLVGEGIKPSSLVESPELKKQIQQLWLDWTDEADSEGIRDFYGLQAQAAQGLFEAGEVFIRLRPRRASDGLSVPLQLQLLESEMLPYGDNRQSPDRPNNYVMNGVEFDRLGRRVGYWFLTQHPGEVTVQQQFDAREQVFVRADQVLHVFRQTRPGQVRGVPIIAPAIVKLWLLDQYDDAELDRHKVAAMFAGFIRSPTPEDAFPEAVEAAEVSSQYGDSQMIPTLEPGTIQSLLPGEDITFATPAEVSGQYEAFQYRNQLALFSAMGIPYTVGTGDLSRVNYSSMRGAIVEFRRRLRQLQHHVMVFQFCRPIYQRWLSDAVMAGALPITDYVGNERAYRRAKWIPPKFEWVDPLKDQQAEKLAVDSGFKSRSDVIEESGFDPEEVDARIAADKAREEKLGLDFPLANMMAVNPNPDADNDDGRVNEGVEDQPPSRSDE